MSDYKIFPTPWQKHRMIEIQPRFYPEFIKRRMQQKMNTNTKETPTELDVLEQMIDEEIRQISGEISRKQAKICALESVKNNIESVRQRFHPVAKPEGATPK